MPAEAERVAAGDDESLLAMDEADDRDVALAEHAVDVGQGVLAAGGVEEMRAGDVAQAVAQRDEAAERSDVRGCERHAGIGGAQLGGGEVEDEVVRADGDDRAVDLADPAQQRDVDVLARVVTFEAGGHDEQAVRAHERREHAGAARQRRRDELAADASEPDAHPVVHAHRRGELAGEPRPGLRALGRSRALERREQRRGEDVEGQRGRDRVAGGAEDRRGVDGAEHDRMARAGRPRRGRQARRAARRRRRCGRRARRSTPRRRSRGRRARRRRARRPRSRRDRRGRSRSATPSHPTASACATSMSELVSRITPGAGSVPTGRISSPVGSTATTGARWTSTSMAPAAAAAATSTARRRCPVGQQQLGRR